MSKEHQLLLDEINCYLGCSVLTEQLHTAIQSILDSDQIAPRAKFTHISQTIRHALKRGEDTGLENGRPKKGSSRAVYFPKDHHEISLDGQSAKVPSVLKVAFHGHADPYNRSGRLLGEHQNLTEGDEDTNYRFGIIRKKDNSDEYETNHEDGILAPHLGSHDDGHYIHQGRVQPIKAGEFRELTKTPEHRRGISHSEFYDALNCHYTDAHGMAYHGAYSPDKIEHLQSHPLVEKAQRFVADAGHHPGDLRKANMGVWTHPHTGQKHIVIADYGFSADVARYYQAARERMFRRY
jgi:hypothetical protein